MVTLCRGVLTAAGADLTHYSIDRMSLESEEAKLRLLKRCTCKFSISWWEQSLVVVFESFASFN